MTDDYAGIRELLLQGKCPEIIAQGKAVVPHLIGASVDGDESVRLNAIYALGEITDGSAVPALVAALEDDNGLARLRAIDALRHISLQKDEGGSCDKQQHQAQKDAVLGLIGALGNGKRFVREYAATTLEEIAEKTGIDLRQVERVLKEFVDSVGGDTAGFQKAKEEAAGYYIRISKAVAGFRASRSIGMEGVILEGTFRPPDKKIYRATREGRAIA